MSYPSDPRLLVLHAVALKGATTPEAVATATGLAPAEVATTLEGLQQVGSAQYRSTSPAGWSLTAVGRKERGVLLAEELHAAGVRPVLEGAYRRFLTVNPELLATCTAWQVRDAGGTPTRNDHVDPHYDAEVVRRLVDVDARARPVLGQLAATLARFGPYRPRLGHALRRVTAGDVDWFTRPVVDSYHSVWFELHQDLLDTLGIERGHEESR